MGIDTEKKTDIRENLGIPHICYKFQKIKEIIKILTKLKNGVIGYRCK